MNENRLNQVTCAVAPWKERRWAQRCTLAGYRGVFVEVDLRESGDWHTCALSDLPGSIPRTLDGGIHSRDLQLLGIQFDALVNLHQPVDAAKCLREIYQIGDAMFPHARGPAFC